MQDACLSVFKLLMILLLCHQPINMPLLAGRFIVHKLYILVLHLLAEPYNANIIKPQYKQNQVKISTLYSDYLICFSPLFIITTVSGGPFQAHLSVASPIRPEDCEFVITPLLHCAHILILVSH
jgi:hypothetical protein